ncbi:hypothetical protein B0A50_07763, partial [Salinomyces thailandicus]
MSRSTDAGHFFQTSDALATTDRKAAKSKNKHGNPLKLTSKILAVLPESGGAASSGVGKCVVLAGLATAPLTSLALCEELGCLFAGCWDKRIHAFPLASHTNTAAGADGEQQPQQQQQQPAPPPLAAHTDFVKCVLTASLDGQPILLSGAADATIIIWDLQTRTPLHKLKGHVKALQDLAIDPFSLPEQGGAATSFELFSASSDREIRRWFISRTAAYELPESLEKPILAHETSVYKLRFDGSGDLWTASADKTAKHLIRDRGWEAETVLPHPDFVRDVVVAELAGVVVTACRDEEVRVWGLGSGELVCVYEGHFEEVMALG